MRLALIAPVLLLILISLAFPATAQQLPQCNSRLFSREGNVLSMNLAALERVFNQRLQAAHSRFSDLQLSDAGDNHLKIAGKKNGTPISISGPLQVTGAGELQLHAEHIKKNGNGMKLMMDLFGVSLGDRMNLQHTRSLNVQGDNMDVKLDLLLGLQGKLTNVQLRGSRIQMQFASQPCR